MTRIVKRRTKVKRKVVRVPQREKQVEPVAEYVPPDKLAPGAEVTVQPPKDEAYKGVVTKVDPLTGHVFLIAAGFFPKSLKMVPTEWVTDVRARKG